MKEQVSEITQKLCELILKTEWLTQVEMSKLLATHFKNSYLFFFYMKTVCFTILDLQKDEKLEFPGILPLISEVQFPITNISVPCCYT